MVGGVSAKMFTQAVHISMIIFTFIIYTINFYYFILIYTLPESFPKLFQLRRFSQFCLTSFTNLNNYILVLCSS